MWKRGFFKRARGRASDGADERERVEQGLEAVSALKECIRTRDLQKGMRIHSELLSSDGSSSNIFVLNTLADMYAKLGNMVEARRVFDAMPHRNVVSWTILISGYANSGESHTALEFLSCMQEQRVPPNARTFVAGLKACSGLASRGADEKLAALERGRALHAQLRKQGLEKDCFVASALVDMYSKCGSLREAREVFDQKSKRDVFSWTALILGYSRVGEGELALELFSRMQEEGFQPDARTFLAAINACACSGLMERGVEIHLQLAGGGFESDIFVASALVDMYSKLGSMVDARGVFERMKQRNLVSWTSLMLGYVQSGDPHQALEIFSRMREEGLEPNARAYVAALKACSCTGNKPGALEKGREIHRELSSRGHDSDSFVGNTLVDMYSKCGSLAEARRAFDRIPSRTIVSWNAMVSGYSEAGEGELALELFARMRDEGFTPDALSFVSALKACGSLGALETGRKLHGLIRSSGLERDALVFNSLISFYGKCGSLEEAQDVFDSSPRRDLFSWSALIAGYGSQGNTERAFDLFERLQSEEGEGLRPDSVTFLSILTACSHAGLVDRGKGFFRLMCSDFSISPGIEHYTAMVDLLGRANRLDEATLMLRGMALEPNSVIWMTILSASRKWRNVAVAREAFEALIRLDEKDSAAYVLMADTYASLGMWEESARVNRMRRAAKAWKKQGQSWWVDGAGVVHRFGVGDRRHPQMEEIRGKLRELLVRMKEAGYEPELESVLYDISDEEKESALCGHSEKLAIACALINTAAGDGSPVRIAKNLRVCGDCHRASEIISKIEKRVLICRDASRFHVFENGSCSCAGFW